MRRAYKFRLYPNINQRREMGIMLETHHRDVNAARNILSRALQARTGPVGANSHEAVAQEAVVI
jgi:hypothetical protein